MCPRCGGKLCGTACHNVHNQTIGATSKRWTEQEMFAAAAPFYGMTYRDYQAKRNRATTPSLDTIRRKFGDYQTFMDLVGERK